MTNVQLYLAVGVPIIANLIFNGVCFTMLLHYMNAKFAAIDQRFVDMEKMWRGELQRVEDVMDARLKSLEEKVR
jgi:hypothetical protein